MMPSLFHSEAVPFSLIFLLFFFFKRGCDACPRLSQWWYFRLDSPRPSVECGIFGIGVCQCVVWARKSSLPFTQLHTVTVSMERQHSSVHCSKLMRGDSHTHPAHLVSSIFCHSHQSAERARPSSNTDQNQPSLLCKLNTKLPVCSGPGRIGVEESLFGVRGLAATATAR